MKTILNRVFPEDISQKIYDNLIELHVNNVVVEKVNTIKNIMSEEIERYDKRKACMICNNYSQIVYIYETILDINERFVKNKFYRFDKEFYYLSKGYIKVLEKSIFCETNYMLRKVTKDITYRLYLLVS